MGIRDSCWDYAGSAGTSDEEPHLDTHLEEDVEKEVRKAACRHQAEALQAGLTTRKGGQALLALESGVLL